MFILSYQFYLNEQLLNIYKFIRIDDGFTHHKKFSLCFAPALQLKNLELTEIFLQSYSPQITI